MLKKFYLGGASAANQCEGAYRIEGGGDSVADHVTDGTKDRPRLFTRALAPDLHYPSHHGIDFYHHFRSDIDLLADAGINMFRFSITWARIFPDGRTLNQAGLDHYTAIIDELLRHQIEPLVTISHCDVPYVLAEKGGWANREMIDRYLNYCSVLMHEWKGKVHYWLPFSEINILENGTGDILSGGLLPKKDQPAFAPSASLSRRFQALHHQFLASAQAVMLAHTIDPENRVGCMVAASVMYPLTCAPADVMKTQQMMMRSNYFCGDVLCRGAYPSFAKRMFQEQDITIQTDPYDDVILQNGTADFFSCSYYMSSCVTTEQGHAKAIGNMAQGVANPYIQASDWGWQSDPIGLRYYLNEIYQHYQIPILVAECGVGLPDKVENGTIHDAGRMRAMDEHLAAVREAAADGVDVFGFLFWGLIDLISLSTGQMSKRYGIIYVDEADDGSGSFRRIKKDSFDHFREITESLR